MRCGGSDMGSVRRGKPRQLTEYPRRYLKIDARCATFEPTKRDSPKEKHREECLVLRTNALYLSVGHMLVFLRPMQLRTRIAKIQKNLCKCATVCQVWGPRDEVCSLTSPSAHFGVSSLRRAASSLHPLSKDKRANCWYAG